MVIEEDELKYNDDGDIIGYEGEGRAILMYIALGAIIGFILGLNAPSPLTVPNSLSDTTRHPATLNATTGNQLAEDIVDSICGVGTYTAQINRTDGRYYVFKNGKVIINKSIQHWLRTRDVPSTCTGDTGG